MFNLLVKAMPDAWDGTSTNFELSRSVREHTAADITARFGSFDEASVAALTQMPAIFAYEKGVDAQPKLGRITAIQRRDNRNEVRIDYELYPTNRFVTNDELWAMDAELDLGNREHWRTHWAVKNVSLGRELAAKGILLPQRFAEMGDPPVDIREHQFEVAFSFPGEFRLQVEAIARATMQRLPTHTCFYDNNYRAQLAVPNLDFLLQDIYSKRTRLVVVFICSHYDRKRWTGIEWHAIRSLLHTAGEQQRLMYIKMDDGDVRGVFPNDGYIDGRHDSAEQIAKLIWERLQVTATLPVLAPRPAQSL